MKLLYSSLFFLFLPAFTFAQLLPPGFAKFEIARDLNPTDLAVAPDGRVFITEKDGLVRVVENGQLLDDPFMILDVEDYNEQGLGHIAIDPEFPAQPFIYLYYTVPDSGGLSHNQVVRVTADGNFAVPGSEVILYSCDPSPATVHNAGDMVFGHDGKLYIGTGDKGRSAYVQSLDADVGKMLRINKDGSIPADNPFYQTATGKYRAIYALGLRNPFSISVQPETGRVFFCDVGSTVWEEINDVMAGKNYGYPLFEGVRTSEPAPADYMDPFFAYDHNTGCAVVGAAFSPVTGGNFPALYRGKFFFGDYCKGFIRMIDPQTGAAPANFATGINRPVAIAISAENDFYYLSRAGIGGGSQEDNTESENGTLWKIIYTGSDAPFVYTHPQSTWRVDGENLHLKTQALGKAPLHYRWQKNGIDLNVPDADTLLIQQVTLADSNATFQCIVSNLSGQDTSDAAILRVTSNQRPIPEIITPAPDFLYRAGQSIAFSGMAVDPETGVLPAAATAWKIDFYHDDHLHPVMTPATGIVADSIYIPGVGEVDDHVWYRLYYTAYDPFGLSKTITRDVFPKKTPVEVHCDVAEIPVNADGFFGKTPYFFNSVSGMERSLSVPGFIDEGDSVLIFQHWENGNTDPYRAFVTPDTGTLSFHLTYSRMPKAHGFGLFGEYFRESAAPWGFDETLLWSRIDSTVNFEWGEGSPKPVNVPNDGFTVSWTGQVVPYNNDTLTFYTFTDDGARLWVNDSLLVNSWQPQGGTELSGSLYLEAGKKYPVRMEFLELGGVATAKLLWSTTRIPKAPIPSRQLYLPPYLIPNSLQGIVWLDVDGDGQKGQKEPPLPGAVVLVKNLTTLLIQTAKLTDSTGRYSVDPLPSGTYNIQVLPPLEINDAEPGFGLSPSGVSPTFTVAGEEHLVQNFGFRIPLDPGTVSWADQAWEVRPNPTDGAVVFRKRLVAYPERFDIRVFSATGKLCLEKTIAEDAWETDLDLSRLAAGVYIVVAGGKAVKVTVF